MIFDLKLIKNDSPFLCECGHDTFIQNGSYYCQQCHALQVDDVEVKQ